MASCRGDSNLVTIDGIELPRITVDAVVHYHDTCISYLLELSKDPNEQYNEDGLTAATILRFYEQIDGSIRVLHVISSTQKLTIRANLPRLALIQKHIFVPFNSS